MLIKKTKSSIDNEYHNFQLWDHNQIHFVWRTKTFESLNYENRFFIFMQIASSNNTFYP